MHHSRLWATVCLWILALETASLVRAEEGMFPMSELGRMNLKERGFQLSSQELFSAGQTCLVDGICRVNGCTGSFVSPDGLIITNHHCAFEAIQNASTTQNDLLTNGFVAKNRMEEIPSPGYTVRITQGFEDISGQVLSVVQPNMSFLERTKAIDKRRKELEREAEAKNAGMRAEVAEMFVGKTYVLFLYTYLKDVRLVFAPPQSIGNFGGEIDNWEWPRHTGDFSFMRAYTAPDGSSADYSPNNVPFKPKRFVKVNPKGVDENDLVFLLGYPGRTVRHKTVSFLEYEQKVRLPMIVDSYAWQIETMEKQGAKDRRVAIQHSARSKSLANVEKRSRGQLLGLQRTDILTKKKEEEKKLQAFIESNQDRATNEGTTLAKIADVYAEMTENTPFEIHLRELRTACRSLSFAFTLLDAATERQKGDLDRETPYMDRNFDQTSKQLLLDVKDLDVPTDRILFDGMLQKLATHKKTQEIGLLKNATQSDQARSAETDKLFAGSKMRDEDFVRSCLKMTPTELVATGDTALLWISELYPLLTAHRDLDKKREGELSKLYGTWMDVKQSALRQDFVPDANGTLRLTHGRVRGYSPSDALYKKPITTVQGILEKTTGKEPFDAPQRLLDLAAKREASPFDHPKLQRIPVAILYSTDTTGGNSGSPVFNASGELVGVNFDRTFEATINDFAWNDGYSRSIGVDIRYVLWVTGTVYSGQHLLKEMGVPAP